MGQLDSPQQVAGDVAILPVGRGNHGSQQQAVAIHENRASGPIDALGGIVPACGLADRTIGTAIAYAWLPPALDVPSQRLEIEYFGERLPAVAAEEPLYGTTRR
jgi:glycine cleavage system aminomethyltransferase T